MRIAMIGTGYVGLVSGACLADFGHDVVCIDKHTAKFRALQRGEMPFFEPGLEDLVRNNVREGRLFIFFHRASGKCSFRRCSFHCRRHSRRGREVTAMPTSRTFTT